MLKIIIFIVLLLFLALLIFINLGRFVDVTQKPEEVDVIVSLGGDSGSRIKKALQLYKQGYSKSHKIIYTGRDQISDQSDHPLYSTKQYLINNDVNENDIIHIDLSMIKNTMEEIFFVKEYMLKHNLKNVMFVSTPFHTRRIKVLADIIAKFDKADLHYTIVGAYAWKNKADYYKNKNARSFVISEMKKLVYNVLKYGTPLIKYTRYNELKKNGIWDKNVNKLSFNNMGEFIEK